VEVAVVVAVVVTVVSTVVVAVEDAVEVAVVIVHPQVALQISEMTSPNHFCWHRPTTFLFDFVS
jgi:hypothetical protein